MPHSKLLSFCILCFILYFAYSFEISKQEDKKYIQKLNKSAQSKIIDKPVSFSNMAPSLKSILMDRGVRYEDVQAGSGASVLCGEEVTLAYIGILPSGENFEVITPENPVKLRVGEQKLVPGLELGIIGMRKDGVRQIAVPPQMAYDHADFTHDKVGSGVGVGFHAFLLGKQLNNGGKEIMPLKIYQDKVGNGEAGNCGQSAKIYYTLYDVRGNILKTNKGADTFTVVSGDPDTPPIISHIIFGMKEGGRRTAIIPNDLIAQPTTEFPFSEAGIAILEVELVEVMNITKVSEDSP